MPTTTSSTHCDAKPGSAALAGRNTEAESSVTLTVITYSWHPQSCRTPRHDTELFSTAQEKGRPRLKGIPATSSCLYQESDQHAARSQQKRILHSGEGNFASFTTDAAWKQNPVQPKLPLWTPREGCALKLGNSSRTLGVRRLLTIIRPSSAIIDLSRRRSQDLNLFFPKTDEPCPVVEKSQQLLAQYNPKKQVVPFLALEGQHHSFGQSGQTCSPSIIPGSAPVSLGKYSLIRIIFQALVPNYGSQPFPNDTFLCIVVAFLTVTLLPQQNAVHCPKSVILL